MPAEESHRSGTGPARGLEWVREELAEIRRADRFRTLPLRLSAQGRRLRTGDGDLLNFASNDYLGLASDPRLAEAAQRELTRCGGWGTGASPLVSGYGSAHAKLERALAEFEHRDAALLFPSGYAANVGAVATLAGKGDVVFSDALNHASLIDGCRLSGARIEVYPHRDMIRLRESLDAARGDRRRLIVTDGLFSMDGDVALLADLAELAERCKAMLLVDEAHATGVLGSHGRGAVEACGVEQAVTATVGTLSKALGSVGGFVAGPSELIELLVNRARPLIFSTASPEPSAAVSLAALQLVEGEPHRRRELLERAERLRDELRARGWHVGDSTSQIIPVLVGGDRDAVTLAGRLREAGIWVPAIRPPSVPEGQARLRISLRWDHRDEDLDALLNALGRPPAGVVHS